MLNTNAFQELWNTVFFSTTKLSKTFFCLVMQNSKLYICNNSSNILRGKGKSDLNPTEHLLDELEVLQEGLNLDVQKADITCDSQVSTNIWAYNVFTLMSNSSIMIEHIIPPQASWFSPDLGLLSVDFLCTFSLFPCWFSGFFLQPPKNISVGALVKPWWIWVLSDWEPLYSHCFAVAHHGSYGYCV